jgi:hypothetical protein
VVLSVQVTTIAPLREARVDFSSSRIHFHIRWNGKPNLDYQCFDSWEATYTRALSIKSDGEAFEIEEVSMDCGSRSKALVRV